MRESLSRYRLVAERFIGDEEPLAVLHLALERLFRPEIGFDCAEGAREDGEINPECPYPRTFTDAGDVGTDRSCRKGGP